MQHRIALPLLLIASLSLLTAVSPRPAPPTGSFTSDQFKLDIASKDGANYTGTIVAADQKYPLTGQIQPDGRLAGEFEANGNKFAFEVVFADANRLTLSTGGATHFFRRATPPNPLDPAAAPVDKPEKDPLAYKVLQLPAGTAAKFDNWNYSNFTAIPNAVYCDAAPAGRENDFLLRTVVGTPSAPDMQNLFTAGPQLTKLALAQIFGPVFKPVGEAKKTTCGGDEALIEQYEGTIQGKSYTCRVIYVKRKDVAVAVLAIGTEAGFKDFGRAVEIAAQSITLKESAIEPALVGTWTKERYITAKPGDDKDKLNLAMARSITFYPNGTFSDTAQSGFSGRQFNDFVQGGNRGKVVKRGNVLTFHYDDGATWSPAYELFSNGLKLDGKVYLK